MKHIAHHEKYGIFNDGRIVSLATNTNLIPVITSNGYYKVTLNGVQLLIHRLIARHFLPNPYDYPQVNHIDGVKTNNSMSNLEWCTATQNIQHAFKSGLRKGYMSMDEKLFLVTRVLSGELIKDIAIEIGRPETGLSGMLRKACDRSGQRDLWNIEMKRRRKDVAVRNLREGGY